MATLGKRNKVVQKPWRPDFRNTEALPDTKVIRTGFLLNAVGVVVALACVIFYGYKEADLQSLASSVRTLQKQVEDATSRDRQILDTNKKFVENASIVSEAVAFDTEAIKFHDFLSQLGDVVQKASLLTDISISHGKGVDSVAKSPPLSINLTGKVFEESQATPAQVLETFQKAILGMECLQGKNPTIEMGRFSRNNDLGHFDFTLTITIPLEEVPQL